MENLRYIGIFYGEKIAILRSFDFGKNWARVSVYDYVGEAGGLKPYDDSVFIYQFQRNADMTLEKFFMDKKEIVGITEEELQKEDDNE